MNERLRPFSSGESGGGDGVGGSTRLDGLRQRSERLAELARGAIRRVENRGDTEKQLAAMENTSGQ